MTQAAFPNQQISEETAVMYLSDWSELAAKYGILRLEKALHDHRHEARFFPQTAELRERMKAMAISTRALPEPDMPCSCSKEKLVELNGLPCEHGSRWALGGLRELMAAKVPQSEVRTVEDVEKRKAELKQQAERMA